MHNVYIWTTPDAAAIHYYNDTTNNNIFMYTPR